MSDSRNYIATLSISDPYYAPNDWQVLIDSNFVKTENYHTSLTLVENSERVLGGMYHFQVFDTNTMQGVRKIQGEYLVCDGGSSWESQRDGLVTLDNMRIGTTNVNSTSSK